MRSNALRLYPEAYLTTLAEFQKQTDDTVCAMLDKGNSLGIFDGETLCGSAALIRFSRPQTSHRAEIAAVYIEPDYQGTDAAATLTRELTNFASESGITQLELFVWDGNKRAISFYTREGFVETGRLPNAVIIDQEPRDDLFMVKLLTP